MKLILAMMSLLLVVGCATHPKDHKVAVCHKGKTLYVDESARDAHVKHGDYGRACYGDHRDHDGHDDDDKNGKGKGKGKKDKGDKDD